MLVNIAGIAIEVHPASSFVQSVLRPFVTGEVPQVVVSGAELRQRTEELAGTPGLEEPPGLCESTALLEFVHDALVEHDCMFFHCALLELDGAMYAIAGPSGAGKSTLARLWCGCLGAVIVNGDKPFLRKIENGWYAASSPWCGKERWGEEGHFAPLRGICFIERARENRIERLAPDRVAELILRQTRMPNTHAGAHALLNLVDSLALTMPAYFLQGNATEATAELSWRTMADE